MLLHLQIAVSALLDQTSAPFPGKPLLQLTAHPSYLAAHRAQEKHSQKSYDTAFPFESF